MVAWLANLSSSVGGNTVLAAAIYGGAVALEKSINPDRRKELTEFLTSQVDHLEPPNTGIVVLTLFEAVFGKRHFSLRCISRSVLVTLLAVVIFGFFVNKRYGLSLQMLLSSAGFSASFLATAFAIYITLFSIVPDYLSLWKGRYLLHEIARFSGGLRRTCLILVDVLLSASISVVVFYAVLFLGNVLFDRFSGGPHLEPFYRTVNYSMLHDAKIAIGTNDPKHEDSALDLTFAACFLSTLFTSIWAILVGASATFLRTLISVKYLGRVTRYLFDVHKRPVESIGIVVAAFVWVCSVLYLIV
jgi:hypothetical protein